MRERDAETFAVQQLTPMERSNWSEGHLDDLNKKVDDGIGRLDEEFKLVRGEMREGFARVDEEFKLVRGEMREGFEKVGDEFKAVRFEMGAGFERMNRTLIGGLATVVAALLTALVAAPHL